MDIQVRQMMEKQSITEELKTYDQIGRGQSGKRYL